MMNRKGSLSSPCIKMEVLDPQPEKLCLITPGIGSFLGAGELLDVKEVVKNFETSQILPNDNLVYQTTETIPPISNSSNAIDQHDPMFDAQPSSDDPNLDPKRMKRLLANRASAQRARQRKFEYIQKLKQDIEIQQTKLAVLAPQLSYHEVEHVVLRKENDTLKEMLRALDNIKLRKEAEHEALKKELNELVRALNLPPRYEK